ncbi:membrane or secreted protein [Formosa maritima]|uniref:Membrane or secreted protein n=1 Tax=Formosa maritima TaxID=2592046 RepID=A0A5D0G5M0_9FLAO|nr:membrane or secreted protein [Formosa maritima]TYA53262.1 membrane or secreted protein [Formosa maritima]
MLKYLILFFCTILSFTIKAQNLIGAWEAITTSEQGEPQRNVLILADGYQVLSSYHASSGKWIHTNGGSWKLDGDTMTEKVEFNTSSPELVGTEISYQVRITDNDIEIVDSHLKFKRIDSGKPGKLQGAWLMSGRIRDGKEQLRDTSGPRKTMKVLSGTRFQWIAYNAETKQFMGTGGGTYTTKDGKYTENIEFFSRDDSKAGLSLQFNYELIDGKWHHSGLSSKGDPIHEIWSIRE